MASESILKQKEQEVKELAEKMKSSSLILFTDYRGINVSDVTDLRTKLRNAEVNGIIQEHIGDLVELLKKMGKYKVSIKETEIPIEDDNEVPFDEDTNDEE